MIEIRNIGNYRVVVPAITTNGVGRPLHFALDPNERMWTGKDQFGKLPQGTKSDLAQYVAKTLLQVREVDGVHVYPDLGHKPENDYTYLRSEPADIGLDRCLAYAVDFNVVADTHVTDITFHTVSVASPGIADPTNLATLDVFCGAWVTAYNTHIALAAQHPNADTTNVCPAHPGATLADCVVTLSNLDRLYAAHKEMYYATGAVSLSPNVVLNYT